MAAATSLVVAVLTFVVVVPVLTAPTAAATAQTGPFLTLLFSRTEVTAANNCVENDDNVVRLDTVVAPTLYALGLHPTGTVETGLTQQSSLWCDHYGMSLAASWDLEQQLASQYGWSFVSHSATYPDNEATWASSNLYDETCGSDEKLVSEGLPGADGLFAWPDNYVYPPAENDVESCFDFNRQYGSPVTNQASATQSPYTESTQGISGGACNDRSAACYDDSSPLATKRYSSPQAVAAIIAGAQPDQWITLQSYVFVSGSQPGQWDCTSPNWQDHWTDDGERYCWNDYLSIVDHLPTDVTVTDPASVAKAWGRTAAGQPSVATLVVSPPTATVPVGHVQTYNVEAFDASGDDLGDVTSTSTFSIDGPGSCAANSCSSPAPGDYTVTVTDGGAAATTALTVVVTSVLAQSVYQWGGKGAIPGKFLTPTNVAGLGGVIQLDAEDGFDYALLSDGTVKAWGQNERGELGDGTTIPSMSAVPVEGLANVVQVDGGNQFGLAVESDGSVWVWGNYGGGSVDVPEEVPGLSHVVQVSAGNGHSLALLSNGTVMAWGANNDGELGNGNTKTKTVPVPVTGLRDVRAVSAGNLFSSALLDDGTVMTWGDNAFGQLGDGSTVNSDVPVAVKGLTGVTEVSAGGNLDTNGHMLALLANGTVEAWGDNGEGQLGDGTHASSTNPIVVGGSDPLDNVVAVSAGGMFSMALLSNGSVSAWGYQTGVLQVNGSSVPITIAGLSDVALIGAGASTAIAGVGSWALNVSPNIDTTVSADAAAAGYPVTVTLTDPAGQPAVGVPLTVTTTGSLAPLPTPPDGFTTGPGGTMTVTIDDVVAGDSGTVQVTAPDGTSATSGTLTIVPGVYTDFTVAGPPVTMTAGAPVDVTVTGVDAEGNPTSAGMPAFTFGGSLLADSPAGDQASVQPANPVLGVEPVTLTPVLAQAAGTLIVSDGTRTTTVGGLTVQPAAATESTPGVLAVAADDTLSQDCTLTGTTFTLTQPGANCAFTITAEDPYGNPYTTSDQSDPIAVELDPGVPADGGTISIDGNSSGPDTNGPVAVDGVLTNGTVEIIYSAPDPLVGTGTLQVTDTGGAPLVLGGGALTVVGGTA
jgi:hypothetical protein